jgi:hypothetical protein
MPAKFNPNVSRIAANVATVLFIVIMLVQLLLAAGILPVSMAWGGRQSELTLGLRIGSIVAVVILGFFLYVIRARAGLIGNSPPTTAIKVLSWVITAFMGLNTLGNLTSVSSTERLVFTPITLLLVASCAVVSLSKP